MTNEEWKETLRVLRVGSPENKLALLDELQKTADGSMVEPLVEILEAERNRAVKERVFLVLSRALPEGHFASIDRLLRSADPFVRNGAVEIIKRNDIPLIQFFEKLAEDENKDVRKFVIDALSQERTPKSIDIIRRRLTDPDVNIVYTAIEYLGNFRDRDSVGAIEEALFATDRTMVICAALEALAKIGVSNRRAEVMAKFSPSTDTLLIFSMLKYLESFGTVDDIAYIESMLVDKVGTCLKEMIDALDGILGRTQTDVPVSLREQFARVLDLGINQVDRYAINKLLARGEGGDSLERARKQLEEEDVMARLSAVEIIAEKGDADDIPRLEEIAGETDSDELLEAIGDAVMKIRDRHSDGGG